MKPIISFCVFGLMFMQARALDPFWEITDLKDIVDYVSDELTRSNNNSRFNLKITLTYLKINKMGNMNSAVNSALSDTTNAIAAAKNEGKDAEHCFEPTRQRLADASNATNSALEKCVDDQLDILKPVGRNIESHLNEGRSLLLSLDKIVMNCSSGNQMQTQLCVAQNMPVASQSVRNFEDTADSLKRTGYSLSSLGGINGIHCFHTRMSNVDANVSAARIFSTNCVKESTK